jgi:hypothetical protein
VLLPVQRGAASKVEIGLLSNYPKRYSQKVYPSVQRITVDAREKE